MFKQQISYDDDNNAEIFLFSSIVNSALVHEIVNVDVKFVNMARRLHAS